MGRFGPGTWIGSTAKSTRDDIARRRKDVRQLGQMLDKFLGHCDSQTGQPELGEIRQIVSETLKSPLRLTARDIQRRLGELLLRDTDDEIRMIDDRAGQPMARRSLVDELFDNENATALPASIQPANRPRPSIVIEIVCIVALLVLLIVGIWQAMS